MSEQTYLIPVLQLGDLDALKAAKAHLGEEGYQTKIESFAALPETEHQEWMTAGAGGYLFYLEESNYKPAMDMLGKFFGCTD